MSGLRGQCRWPPPARRGSRRLIRGTVRYKLFPSFSKTKTIVDDFKQGNTILIFGCPFSKEKYSVENFEEEIGRLRLMTYSEKIRIDQMLITDSGWGCSIRTVQMLFFNTLKRKINFSDNQLFEHFIDNGDGVFNFQKVLLEGIFKFNQKIERYWNFKAALKSFENILSRIENPPLKMMISDINLFEIKEIKKHFSSPNESGKVAPLMLSAIIILQNNEEKVAFLKEWMKCPYFCGMLFGKNSRAYYGFGFCENLKVTYFMDPHEIKKVSKISDFVCDHFPSIPVKETSDSFVVNLLLKNSADFEGLMSFFNKNVKSDQVAFQEEILNSEYELHTNEESQAGSLMFESVPGFSVPQQKPPDQKFTNYNIAPRKISKTKTQQNGINDTFIDADQSKIFQDDQSCDENQGSKIFVDNISLAEFSKNKNQTLKNSSPKRSPHKNDVKVQKNQIPRVETNGRKQENLGKNTQSRPDVNQTSSSNGLPIQPNLNNYDRPDSNRDVLFNKKNSESKPSNQELLRTNFKKQKNESRKVQNTISATKPPTTVVRSDTGRKTGSRQEAVNLSKPKGPSEKFRRI